MDKLRFTPPLTSSFKIRMSRAGFTLVEMMVALLIFSVIAVTMHAVLRTGLRTWQVGNEWASENQTARIVFSTISKDLKNSVNYSKDMPFDGEREKISFMTLVDSSLTPLSKERKLAKVIYAYDADKKIITRTLAGKEEGFDEKIAENAEWAQGVESLEFRYAYKPAYESETFRWKEKWKSEEKIPRGVQIKLNDFKMTVFLPLGELGDEANES